MVVRTHTGAQDGPPTTVLATIGALMGAARAATWCVSCRHLVTDWETRALLTMACTFAFLPFPPLWDFFLGAPDGTSLALEGAA